MYSPSQFVESDPQILTRLMQAHPLATLITLAPDGLTADHIPLLWQPQESYPDAAAPAAQSGEPVVLGVLRGHVARANPLWQKTDLNTDVLAVFQSAGHYISPGWYPTKQEHGKAVPTWNYQVVHASGRLRVMDDAQWLRGFLQQLTTQHESGMAQPWDINEAPADYIDKMLTAIVGIEIVVSKLSGKSKVSQNQPAVNRQGVVAGLQQVNTAAALAMAQLVAER